MLHEIAIPFPDISPFVFQLPRFEVGGVGIGPLGLRWYALAYIAGLLAAWRLMLSLSASPRLWGVAQSPVSRDDVDDLIFYAIIGVLVGGRLGFVLFYQPHMLGDPLSVLRIWEGGMSFHGGLIGVTLATVATALTRKISLLALGDAVALASPIGLALGRVANFINQELWGRPSEAAWAFVFKTDPAALPRHPSQLYQASMEGVLLFVILALAVWKGGSLKRPGLTAGLFLIGYALFRVIGEQFREPDRFAPSLPDGLTMGMVLSFPMALIGFWLVTEALRRPKRADAAS